MGEAGEEICHKSSFTPNLDKVFKESCTNRVFKTEYCWNKIQTRLLSDTNNTKVGCHFWKENFIFSSCLECTSDRTCQMKGKEEGQMFRELLDQCLISSREFRSHHFPFGFVARSTQAKWNHSMGHWNDRKIRSACRWLQMNLERRWG